MSHRRRSKRADKLRQPSPRDHKIRKQRAELIRHYLGEHVHEILIRENGHLHVTLYLNPQTKIDWWPASGCWTNPGESIATNHGDLEQLYVWLKEDRGDRR